MPLANLFISNSHRFNGLGNGAFLGFFIGMFFPMWFLTGVGVASSMLLPFAIQGKPAVPHESVWEHRLLVSWLALFLGMGWILCLPYWLTGIFLPVTVVVMVVAGVVISFHPQGESIPSTVQDMRRQLPEYLGPNHPIFSLFDQMDLFGCLKVNAGYTEDRPEKV